MAVVKLPNGRIHFVELASDPMNDVQLTDLITKLNDRSAETKSKNVQVGKNKENEDILVRKTIDFNRELNDEIVSNLFISVPQIAKGTYIDFALNDTGSLELTFHKKVEDKNIRRQIYVYGKTLADPVNFKDADDMLEQINAAIEKHDKEYAKNDSHKIGFKLTKENFKVSVPDAISVSQLENNQVEIARRDTKEKTTVSMDGITETVSQLLLDIQSNLFNRAKKYRDEHITKADNWDEFVTTLDTKAGFVSAHWDGTPETEDKIKEMTKATIRCIPLNNEQEAGTCILTGKPSVQRVLFARAY